MIEHVSGILEISARLEAENKAAGPPLDDFDKLHGKLARSIMKISFYMDDCEAAAAAAREPVTPDRSKLMLLLFSIDSVIRSFEKYFLQHQGAAPMPEESTRISSLIRYEIKTLRAQVLKMLRALENISAPDPKQPAD